MKKLATFLVLAVVASGMAGGALAAPSAVGTYGGMSEDGATFVSFDSTARGLIQRIEIAGLSALCMTEIPGQPTMPAVVRSTNITRRETPTLRLRANGRFSGTFALNSRSRVDFRGATVRISGRLSGYRGTVTVRLTMDKTYADGSRETCGGSATVQVRAPRRR